MINITTQISEIEEEQRSVAPPLPSDGVRTFTRVQAADYLRTRWGLAYARRTLVVYAVRGTGPEFFRLGARVVYTRQALDEWAKSKVTAPGRKASELKPLSECGGVNA